MNAFISDPTILRIQYIRVHVVEMKRSYENWFLFPSVSLHTLWNSFKRLLYAKHFTGCSRQQKEKQSYAL